MKIKILIVLAILAAAGLAAFYWPAGDDPKQEEAADSGPMWITGDVVRVEGFEKVYVAYNGREITAVLGNFSEVIAPQKQKDGTIKNLPAQLSEFTPKSRVMIYYTEPPVGDVYKAVKIQKTF